MPTKNDVWRGNVEYRNNRTYRRWQNIMRRASKYGRLYTGELYPINPTLSFVCSICRHDKAAYAYYPRLLLFCEQHAEEMLALNGLKFWWRRRESG